MGWGFHPKQLIKHINGKRIRLPVPNEKHIVRPGTWKPGMPTNVRYPKNSKAPQIKLHPIKPPTIDPTRPPPSVRILGELGERRGNGLKHSTSFNIYTPDWIIERGLNPSINPVTRKVEPPKIDAKTAKRLRATFLLIGRKWKWADPIAPKLHVVRCNVNPEQQKEDEDRLKTTKEAMEKMDKMIASHYEALAARRKALEGDPDKKWKEIIMRDPRESMEDYRLKSRIDELRRKRDQEKRRAAKMKGGAKKKTGGKK